MTGARVDAHTEEGDVRFVLSGEIDLANAATVEEQLAAAVTNHTVRVRLDLSAVTYLDSAGLRVLFHLVDRLSTLQIAATLVAPLSSPSRRAIDLSGLALLVPLDPPAPAGRGAGQASGGR
ncbi:MAG TPA: STAS domain-containing protein [Acidimicrobiales bacterium]|nr:STAS domain-containing protein [Acidimicrobiales bacterium]